jgi:hypothetical protein
LIISIIGTIASLAILNIFLFLFLPLNIYYGDVYPVIVLGKLLSGIVSILGIILIALPSGIISSGFIKEYEDEKMRRSRRKIRKGKK